ncbi:MAG: carboxypeptidase-like regulatory domain-containing protein [Acidobacteriota bacterium]|nr:carboxypeptidase-like regulatory domain-containing protein [Blastocatellia bacterium]MDW8238643.1 carboxypeptidase-like regulatory domain-containing protein [Acidobacteriota bacterium]
MTKASGYVLIIFCMASALAPTLAQDKRATSGRLRGSVQDQDGKPLADIRVRAINRRTDERVAEVITNDEGVFVFDQLPEGRYTLTFYSPRFQQAIVSPVEIKAGQEKRLRDPVELKPVKLYAVIEGAVFDHRGFLLRGATVVIERIPFEAEPVPSFRQESISNDGGAFAFRVSAAPARYRLTASLKGYKSQSTSIDIAGNERRHVSIQLEPEP